MSNGDSNRGMGDALIAFGVGLLAGVAVGLMLAPASGSETRKKLGQMAEKMRDSAVEGAEKASDFVKAQARRGFRAGEDV